MIIIITVTKNEISFLISKGNIFLILTSITSIKTTCCHINHFIGNQFLIFLQKARVLDENLTRHQDICNFIFPYIFLKTYSSIRRWKFDATTSYMHFIVEIWVMVSLKCLLAEWICDGFTAGCASNIKLSLHTIFLNNFWSWNLNSFKIS